MTGGRAGGGGDKGAELVTVHCLSFVSLNENRHCDGLLYPNSC
ncbi:hypothetical protein NEIELOOT_01503 [Neisseria elongata subsp. glycolytica ATCC 29315]|uniref:Uncharacterized protein n=1 Tax=Neisseria elongata subsp. glycolytica ATCC 29315 TaxID=546263 RepID=D4DR10_NEIEG|nr:hypothetical protein NEIELOOT_01503 [Neisseria elongata subsp. glycolytica ATCC 29315]